MSYTGEQVDEITARFERCCERQAAMKGSTVKLRAAERDTLQVAEELRDLFVKAVKGDKWYLEEVFGGAGLVRFHRIRNAMGWIEFSEMHATDQRWPHLTDSMDSIEEVLKQLGLWKPFNITKPPESLKYNLSCRRFAPGDEVKMVPSLEGGDATMFWIEPGLPEGLQFMSTTGEISGQLKGGVEVPETTYTVTAENNAGSAVAKLTFAVKEAAPSSLSYANVPPLHTIGEALTLEPQIGGGAVSTWWIEPALPKGLDFDTSTGVISGTPQELTSSRGYTVTAANGSGETSTTVTFAVILVGPASLSYPGLKSEYPHQLVLHLEPCLQMKNSKPPQAQSGWKRAKQLVLKRRAPADMPMHMKMALMQVEYCISPALPAGLVIIKSTGIITGAPTETREKTSYTITAWNDGGEVSCNVAFAIKLEPPKGLSYPVSETDVFLTGVPLSLSPTVEGLVETWSVDPAFPAGVQLDPAMGIISGMPTATAPADSWWCVTATNAQGSTEAWVSFIVKRPAPQDLQYPGLQSQYPVTRPVEDLQPTYKGEVDGFVVEPPLPAGLKIDEKTGEIWGTPTAACDAAEYWVTTWNETGEVFVSITFAVAVLPPSNLKYPKVDEDYIVNEYVELWPQHDGGVTTWALEPALPKGLHFEPTSGSIWGSPESRTEEASYVVTGSNASGSTSTVLTFSIRDPPVSGLSYPNMQEEFIIGKAVSISPQLETGICTKFVVKPALPAGMTFDAATGVIAGAPTAPSEQCTYVITGSNADSTSNCEVSFCCKELAPDGLTYPDLKETYTAGEMIKPHLVPSLHAGVCSSYIVTPALPGGVSLDAKTGIISGTPDAADMKSYEVTGSNSGGSTTFELCFECVEKEKPAATAKRAARPARKGKDEDETFAEQLEGVTELDKMPSQPDRKKKMQWMLWMAHRAHLGDATLKDLSFKDMKMPLPHVEPRIAPKLVNALSFNTVIINLDLGNSNLQKPQGSDLGESMSKNCTLKKLCIESNCLDADAMIAVVQGIGKNEASVLEEFRFANQKGLHHFGRPLEEAMAKMLETNTVMLKCDLTCTDPHWRNKVDKAFLRNVENLRKRKKAEAAGGPRTGVLQTKTKGFSKIVLQAVPDFPSWEVFSGEDLIDQQMNLARKCAATQKTVPSIESFASFVKEEGASIREADVAVLVKAFTSKFMGSFKDCKVSLTDDLAEQCNGKLEIFGEKNDRWSLDVWLDEGARCTFTSSGTPVVEFSDAIAAWVNSGDVIDC